jgi:hypothetical protein
MIDAAIYLIVVLAVLSALIVALAGAIFEVSTLISRVARRPGR